LITRREEDDFEPLEDLNSMTAMLLAALDHVEDNEESLHDISDDLFQCRLRLVKAIVGTCKKDIK
jgi:hypothetical protein